MNNNMVAQPQTTEQPVRITSPAEAKLCPSLGLWHPPALAASPDSSWRSANARIFDHQWITLALCIMTTINQIAD